MEFDLSLSFREAKRHEKTFRNLFIVAQVAVSFILSIALLYGCGLETVGRKIRSETSGEAIRQSEIHKKSAENSSERTEGTGGRKDGLGRFLSTYRRNKA